MSASVLRTSWGPDWPVSEPFSCVSLLPVLFATFLVWLLSCKTLFELFWFRMSYSCSFFCCLDYGQTLHRRVPFSLLVNPLTLGVKRNPPHPVWVTSVGMWKLDLEPPGSQVDLKPGNAFAFWVRAGYTSGFSKGCCGGALCQALKSSTEKISLVGGRGGKAFFSPLW